MTPPQSQTPETDALELRRDWSPDASKNIPALIAHARSLETRLNEALTRRDFYKIEYEGLNVVINQCLDAMGPNKLCLSEAILELQQERTSLLAQQALDTECIERIRNHGYELELQVEQLTAQIAVLKKKCLDTGITLD